MRAEPVTAPLAAHGEGPCWEAQWGGLRWVDMLAGDVLSLEAATGQVRRRHVGTVAAALRPRRGGGMVLALERGFALDEPQGELTLLEPVWQDSGVRMNDGGCDPHGRFYCGSMAYDGAAGRGALYRLNHDLTVTTVLTGVTISNGLAWSPDGSLAYYVDTPTRRIDVFDYTDDGVLTGRRPFATVRRGFPDGLTVDAQGGVWVALWDGGAVHRYSPTGELEAVVKLPVTRPTACTFGGDAFESLYITTSQLERDLAAEPLAGAVFRVDPGVAGLAPAAFAG